MIKKILLIAALVLPMCAAAQSLKIGIVNPDDVVQKMPEYTEAQNKFVETSKRYEDEFGKLQEELKRKYDDLQNMPENELEAIKERKLRDFQEYQAKVQQFQQTAEQELAKVQQELMAPIEKKVQDAIRSVGQEGNFSLIEPNISGIILYYADPVVDITNEVKAKLGIN
ncbi:MAG: OmpH family outer membrane protein [Muribaculaceae bacterium]|nr:OmpH family outer membrane protein [Muribaculaceae bacterium]